MAALFHRSFFFHFNQQNRSLKLKKTTLIGFSGCGSNREGHMRTTSIETRSQRQQGGALVWHGGACAPLEITGVDLDTAPFADLMSD